MLSFHWVTSPLRRLSNATHTWSSPPGLFYKLEQLRFTASTAGHGRPGQGWLWMENYEQETRAGSRPFFLPWLSVSTHHREKQLGYKLASSLTLTNVLPWTTKQPARTATRLSCRHSSTDTFRRRSSGFPEVRFVIFLLIWTAAGAQMQKNVWQQSFCADFLKVCCILQSTLVGKVKLLLTPQREQKQLLLWKYVNLDAENWMAEICSGHVMMKCSIHRRQ